MTCRVWPVAAGSSRTTNREWSGIALQPLIPIIFAVSVDTVDGCPGSSVLPEGVTETATRVPFGVA